MEDICYNKVISTINTSSIFCYIYVDGSILSFLELGNTTSVTQTFLTPALDGASDRIDIPGFQFGIMHQTFVHVS